MVGRRTLIVKTLNVIKRTAKTLTAIDENGNQVLKRISLAYAGTKETVVVSSVNDITAQTVHIYSDKEYTPAIAAAPTAHFNAWVEAITGTKAETYTPQSTWEDPHNYETVGCLTHARNLNTGLKDITDELQNITATVKREWGTFRSTVCIRPQDGSHPSFRNHCEHLTINVGEGNFTIKDKWYGTFFARYDTFAQVEQVITRLKDVFMNAHGIDNPEFTFPTVDELNTPPAPVAETVEDPAVVEAQDAAAEAEIAIVETPTVEDKDELPSGNVTVNSGAEAWAVVGKHFPKGNLEFYRAYKGFNNEDKFCYTLDEIIYVHVTCTPDNSRVELIEVINTYESGSARRVLTVNIAPPVKAEETAIENEPVIVETANEEPDGYNPDVFSLLPKLEDLNDVDGEFDGDAEQDDWVDACGDAPSVDDEQDGWVDSVAPKPDSPFDIARGLNDAFRKIVRKVDAPYMEVTTQDDAKIATTFGAAYISVDWRAVDGYVFGNHYDDVLARYDTPEQVTEVMTALRDAIRAGKTEITFPTVEELTAPPEPDDAKSTFDRVVKTRRHGIGHVTTKQGRHMWYIYGRLVNKKEITEWLADEGFTVEEYIAAEKVADKYEEEVEFPRRMAIREQAEFLRNKIADDRKASVEPMPALFPTEDSGDDDELIDPPIDERARLEANLAECQSKERAKWQIFCEACDNYDAKKKAADDALHDDTFDGDGYTAMEDALSDAEKQMATTYELWGAAKDAMCNADRDLEEYDRNVERISDSLTRAMNTALELYKGFCRAGNLTKAENELKLYNICRKAKATL